MKNLTIVLIMILSSIGPAIIIAVVGQGAVKAVGRNPSASSRILLAMVFAFLFAEAIAVISLLMIYTLFK